MTILYDIIFIILFVLYFPVLLIRGKWHSGFVMRFGSIPPGLKQKLTGKSNIWFHAVSVGEVLAVTGLIGKVKEAFPQHQIVVSTVTTTGYELAQSQLGRDHIVIYAPLDITWVVRKYIKAIQPQIYISTETEIWPNLFAALGVHRVPVLMVNGRISEKSFQNYRRVKFLLKPALNAVTVFCMQSPADAARIKELGVDPAKIQVTGNVKFDDIAVGAAGLPPGLHYKSHEMIWVAGSTHPGEEKIVLDVFHSLQKEFPTLRLIIAPRHIERAADVTQLVEAAGLKPLRLSELVREVGPRAVLVVDTVGHLRSLYQLGTVVFVGKSLTGKGGQNIIEPAFFSKPVIVGPHMQNFRSIMALFQEAGAIIQVKDSSELLSQMQRLLRDPKARTSAGVSAKKVIQQNQGATNKTCQTIVRTIPRS